MVILGPYGQTLGSYLSPGGLGSLGNPTSFFHNSGREECPQQEAPTPGLGFTITKDEVDANTTPIET